MDLCHQHLDQGVGHFQPDKDELRLQEISSGRELWGCWALRVQEPTRPNSVVVTPCHPALSTLHLGTQAGMSMWLEESARAGLQPFFLFLSPNKSFVGGGIPRQYYCSVNKPHRGLPDILFQLMPPPIYSDF